jgi:hypothetical protein
LSLVKLKAPKASETPPDGTGGGGGGGDWRGGKGLPGTTPLSPESARLCYVLNYTLILRGRSAPSGTVSSTGGVRVAFGYRRATRGGGEGGRENLVSGIPRAER